jgi:hypothetical protein
MPAENGAGSRTHSMGTLNRKDNADGKSGFGTLTLGRSKEKKMELLRAKLHTDEELNWVDHSKTLREQGIDETETLLLRRKYFFSDTNVDSRDPVQLNLLYVQCRDGKGCNHASSCPHGACRCHRRQSSRVQGGGATTRRTSMSNTIRRLSRADDSQIASTRLAGSA